MALTHVTYIDDEYRIEVSPLRGRLGVVVGGVQVAETDDARVLFETYLPPCVYIPRADVAENLLKRSTFRTFCPFKGTATYWSLNLPSGLIENACWSYDAPRHAGVEVGGMLSFSPDLIDRLEGDDEVLEFLQGGADDQPKPPARLTDWLLMQAWLITEPAELTRQLAHRLIESGMPLMRLNIGIWTLHPQLAGMRYTWTKDGDSVKVGNMPRGVLNKPAYLKSPVRFVSEGLGGVRQRLDEDDPEFQFPVMSELRQAGGTDYVAMPLPFSDGQINTLTLTSDDPKGFTIAGLGQLYVAIPTLGRLYETHVLRQNTATLLDTYLGPRTGERVLKGLIQLGDGESINAVIWYCDLRNSSTMADNMTRPEFLADLNQFFDVMAGSVSDHGGEVLRFIGDAVLAIFPTAEGVGPGGAHSAGQASIDAVDAVRAATRRMAEVNETRTGAGQQALGYGIALHLGDVTYGNIGTPDRLEFTVIGAAANEATRLEGLCKEMGFSVLLSGDFAPAYPENLHAVGRRALRGVAEEMDIFTLPEHAGGTGED